jgi:hypothetical protein
MDQWLENELLMQIAAGTDPLTALAALPRDHVLQCGPQQAKRRSSFGVCAIVAMIVFIALMLMR